MRNFTFILKSIVLLCVLTFSTNAWGRTLTAKVAVGSGEGTATVEIYNGYGQKKKTVSSSSSEVATTSYGMSIVEWAYSKYSASASAGYTFEGWYTNSACTSGKQTDNPYETSTSQNQTRMDQYWAKFVPVTVNSVTPGSKTVTFTKPGTQTVTLTFNVSNADNTNDFNTPTISNSEWTLKSWSYNDDKVTVVVSFTVASSTNKADDHSATVTLTSKGTSTSQSKSATVNAVLDMDPVFTNKLKSSYYVDDATLNLAALWTSSSNGDIQYTMTFTPSSTNNAGMTTGVTLVDNQLTLGQAGTVVLTLTQAESNSFNEGSDTKTITINKRPNTITVDGFDNAAHEIKTDWYDNYISLTANNTDYTTYPINNERIEGDDTQASFGSQDGAPGYWVVYTAQNTGTVRWRVWQAENYKYVGAENTFAVKVIIVDECSCVLKEETWDGPFEKAVGDIGEWDFGGIGETLSFELRSNFAAGNHMTYTLKTDGTYEDPVKLKAESELYFTSVGTIALGEGDHNTTAVVFAKSSAIEGLNTDNPYVHNIVVTRKRWMKLHSTASATAEISELTMPERMLRSDSTEATFYVNFSTCAEMVKVASDDSHVTFTNNLLKDTISTEHRDTVAVTLKYSSDVVEDKVVRVTVYTDCENVTLLVHVKTNTYIFLNGSGDKDWDNGANWNVGSVPGKNDVVIIREKAEVNRDDTVYSVTIDDNANYSLTIMPTGGLTVGAGGISGARTENLILKADQGADSDTRGQTGYLRISPDYTGAMPEATVELFSIAYYDMSATNHQELGKWQFIGYPVTDNANAKAVFSKSWLYDWNAKTGEWENNRKTLELKPFAGYATSQYRDTLGLLVTFDGRLVPNEAPKEIVLTYNEGSKISHNMIANSYTAPIDITKFDLDDFENTEAAIYLFNTGSRKDTLDLFNAGAKRGETFDAPGQYIHIPVTKVKAMKSAFSEKIPTSIAPMQGFCVHAIGANPKITLDYSKLVWGGNYTDNGNGPLRVRAHETNEAESVRSLCVTLFGGGLSDNLYMLESEENNPAFENGSDARKIMSGELNIFSVAGEDELAVDATNSFIGTRVGVRTGEETMYTMFFSHLNSEKELALLDWETEQITEITENAEYTFFAEPNSMITDRFEIIEWDGSNKPGIATGVENVENGTKVHKFIKDNQLFILKNGVLYNATGVLVR